MPPGAAAVGAALLRQAPDLLARGRELTQVFAPAALYSLHLGVELFNGLTARANKYKGQQCMEHASDAGPHHTRPEEGRAHQVLSIGLAYGLGVLGE